MTHLIDKLPFRAQPWFMYLRSLLRHFVLDNCTQKAASLTYTTLLSLVPVITVLLVVFSSIPALADIKEQILASIYSNMLPSSGIQVQHYLDSFSEKSANLTAVGVLMLFVTAIMTLITIETAFNQIWRVQDRTGGTHRIMRYWTMITLGPIILSVAFAASSTVRSLDFLNRQIAGYGIDWGLWAEIVSFVVMSAGFVGMYWFIPKAKVPWRNALIAGMVVAVLFECVKRTFGIVMVNFTSYEAIYGAFAALPVFLLWIYLSWNLILLGVEISYTLTIFESKEVAVRHPILSLLDMLNLIFKNYQQGRSTSEQALRDTLGRKELPKWQIYLAQLAHNDLIIKTESEEYTLKKDLSSISLWQFYKTLPYPLPIKDELDKLKQADYDPWFDALYAQLANVERHAKAELNINLASLFTSAPLREKQDSTRLTFKHKPDAPADSTGSSITHPSDDNAVSFDADATCITDGAGSNVILPIGDKGIQPTRPNSWRARARHVRKLIKQGHKKVRDFKARFNN